MRADQSAGKRPPISRGRLLSPPLLLARQLRCERDDRLLFDSLSFAVDAGELLQVEGPNGSGKTTLLRCIAGLSSAWEGELQWRGEPWRRERFAAELLYIGHATGIKRALTPLENLRWQCALGSEVDEAPLWDALARVGLRGYEDSPCHSLSAGQQRRVALARLFVSPAVCWILDEPFTAIDKRGVRELEQALREHLGKGGLALLTTHQDLQSFGPVRRVLLGDAA